jgi:hypothetical protein
MEGRDMLLVARQAVEGLGEDDIDLAVAHGILQCLHAGAEHRGAGDGGIRKAADQLPSLALDVGPADAELVLDGMLRLPVRRIPGIDADANTTQRCLGGPVHDRSPFHNPMRAGSTTLTSEAWLAATPASENSASQFLITTAIAVRSGTR